MSYAVIGDEVRVGVGAGEMALQGRAPGSKHNKRLEFHSLATTDGRKKTSPASCPLASMYMPWHAGKPIHIH